MSTQKLIKHEDVQYVLLELVEVLERSGAHFVITRDLAKRLKSNLFFDDIDKIRVAVSDRFLNDNFATDILLTLLENFKPILKDSIISFNYKDIDVKIKFSKELHKTLIDPDYVNVLGEKVPLPNPWPEYLKQEKFI